MGALINLLNPWLLVGTTAALCLSAWGGYRAGAADTRAALDRERLGALHRLIDQQAALAAQDREVLAADVARQGRVETQFRVIDREVNRYALTHRDAVPCLDPDGLRAWRAAARGDAAAIAAAEPGVDYRLSAGPAGAGLGLGAGPAGQLRGGGAALPPAAGALPGPVRLGAGARPDWGWR